MDAILQTAARLVLGALAIWRIGLILTQEEGPFGVFEILRLKLGVYVGLTWFHRGLACVLCLTFWPCLAFGLWMAWYEGVSVFVGLAYGLAANALIVLLQRETR